MKKTPTSPVRSIEDKRITRMHQMEQMEAAARGTHPTYTLDTTSLDDDTEDSPPRSSSTVTQSLLAEPGPDSVGELPTMSATFERTVLVADDFLSSIVSTATATGTASGTATATGPPAPPSASSSSSRSRSGNYFSQRDKYEVDQSINLMDASSKRYSVEETRRSRKGRSTSFVDIFLGGNGTTTGSSSVAGSDGARDSRSSSNNNNKGKNNVKTSWKTSTMGRVLILLIFLGFMALLTLSIPFFASDNATNSSVTTTGQENKLIRTGSRTAAPTFDHAATEVSRIHFHTNEAATGPATFARVDYFDTKVKDEARFDQLKLALLNQEATQVERLSALKASSAFHAVRWLADDDPMQLESDDPALPTRFALATFFFATHIPTSTTTQTQLETSAQRQAVEQKTPVVTAPVNTQWTRENDWMTGSSVCEWYGVACETVDEDSELPAHVVHLNVTSNALRGTIPPELAVLSKVVLLDLSSNELSGSIPPLLGHLDQLKYLLLQKNALSGPIPQAIGGMAAAYQIYLSRNQLTGTIPGAFGNLNNLRALDLGQNQLTGKIDMLGQLQDINHLHLDHNAFEGPLPSTISRLTMLNDLRLEKNKLTGTVPPEMAANTRLRLLYLGDNQLEGNLPDMFENLNKLTDLQLHGNHFKSELPVSMGSLTSLRRLTLEGNIMTGHLPTEWGQMTDLEALELYHNELVGNIPTEFGQLRNLHDLALGKNFLQGSIPSELGLLTQLKSLGLQHTALKGALPSELGNIKTLVKLGLTETLVTGTVPEEICALTEDNNLQVLEADCKSKIECSCCSKCM